MSAWKSVALGDVCDVTAGGTPSRASAEYFDGGIPWVKIGDMLQGTITATEETISKEGLRSSAAKLLPPGTVLISIFATIGRTAVLGVEAATNQAIAGVTPRDPNVLTPNYLRRYLDSVVSALERRARGVAQVNINSGILRGLPIPVPPSSEQRWIAEILDKADALRTKRRAALAQLNAITQSIFLNMFGDPATNPKGWPASRLGELADVQGGLQVMRARKSHPRAVPYLRVANVYRGFIDLTEVKTIRATEAEIARTTLAEGDLLVVEGHGNPSEIGRAALWDGSISQCVHQNHIIRARFDTNKVVPQYACEFLNSLGGRRHLLRSGKTTSGLNTISVSEVRGAPILLPPVELQRDFIFRGSVVEKARAIQRASLSRLDTLFVSLQHRAFRGEL